jgi:MFS family permease
MPCCGVISLKHLQVWGGRAMRGSDLEFFNFFFTGLLGFFALVMIVAIVIPIVLAGLVAAIHLRLRADREQVEGIHTVAAYGSRAGAKLGFIAGLVLSGGGMLVSLLSMTGSGSMSGFLTIYALCGVIPGAAWGMLSGSIAGNRSNERTAGLVGAVMFLLLANPFGSLLFLSELVQHPENFFEQFPALLGHLAMHVVYLAAGAVTGVLAVRLGRERLAEGFRPMPEHTQNPWATDGRN